MRRVTDERGAVAIMTALLVVVLVGLTALAVDSGALWWDKKQLQNGADAAALALAQSCAQGSCEADEMGMANDYATGNKKDANVSVVAITHGATWVKVDVTTTRVHWFAPVIGNSASEVTASATASWGGVKSASVLPLTFSACQLGPVGGTVLLKFKDEMTDCIVGSPPHSLPGGFGWLDDPDSVCAVQTSIDNWVYSGTGASGPTGAAADACDAILSDLENREVLIPFFDDKTGTGSNAQFHLAGYAVIRVDEYCLNHAKGWLYTAGSCNASSRWLAGTYVKKVDLGATLGGPDHGATTVQLTA